MVIIRSDVIMNGVNASLSGKGLGPNRLIMDYANIGKRSTTHHLIVTLNKYQTIMI